MPTNLLLAIFVSLLLPGVAATADSGAEFDEPRLLHASLVLPDDLVSAPHHVVKDDITTVEALHLFSVESDWGTLDVYGESLLRVRLHELSAIATLQDVSTAYAGGKAAGKAATQSLKRIGQAIEDPVGTVKGIPGGIVRMFKGIGRDIGEMIETGEEIYKEHRAGGPAVGEKSAVEMTAVELARRYAKITKNHREWAQRVGVDPYTTNPVLQDELERLGITAGVAELGTSFILPQLPTVLGIVASVSDTVYRKDWRDLFESNRKMMEAMGADEGTISGFEYSEALTPSLMTLIVSNLNAMEGVDNRHVVVQQASLLESEAEALFFAECVLMALYYHENEAPVTEFLLETLIPVALDTRGRVVAFSAVDAAYWNRENAALAPDFTNYYDDYSDTKLFWIADYASPLFLKNMTNLGWTVSHDLRQRVLPEIPWGMQDE